MITLKNYRLMRQYLWRFYSKYIRFTRLDRYLLTRYFISIFFACLLFVLIAVPIDYSERVSAFIEAKDLTTKMIITNYFLPFIPSLMAILANIIVFISVIFFTSKLASRSEFIAISAAGIGLHRVLRPYFLGSLIIAGLLFWGNDSFLPKINSIKADFTLKYIDHADFGYTHYHYYAMIDSSSLMGITEYNSENKSGSGVLLERYEGNRVYEVLRARQIYWDSTKKEWVLVGIIKREIQGYKEVFTPISTMSMQTVITPENLEDDIYMKERLNNQQLLQKIELEKIKGSDQVTFFEIEYYQRAARPISIIILTLIGAIMASRKVRGGGGMHLAIGVIISMSYILLERFASVFATNAGFNPVLATWTPNIIYVFVVYFLYKKAPK